MLLKIVPEPAQDVQSLGLGEDVEAVVDDDQVLLILLSQIECDAEVVPGLLLWVSLLPIVGLHEAWRLIDEEDALGFGIKILSRMLRFDLMLPADVLEELSAGGYVFLVDLHPLARLPVLPDDGLGADESHVAGIFGVLI